VGHHLLRPLLLPDHLALVVELARRMEAELGGNCFRGGVIRVDVGGGRAIADQLIMVERLAYSATAVEQELAEEARRTAQILSGAEEDLKQNRGPLNSATGQYDPPQHLVDAVDVARTDVQDAIQRLDDHLRSQLRPVGSRPEQLALGMGSNVRPRRVREKSAGE